ncbi:MAG: DUF928 domain-containing protein [Cyanobacteria bacterium J06621_11]
MRKIHVLSAFVLLAAWAGNYTPHQSLANSVQLGAAANAEVRWTPNPNRGNAGSSMSGGRRGTPFSACALDHDQPDPTITLLAPDGQVNLTTKAQPTLSWFLETDSTVNMEFMLSDGISEEPVHVEQIQSEGGLVELSLPESAALKAGITYRWTVFVECDGGEYFIHARSFVERTEEMDTAMASNIAPVERADAYASQGIWYDALNTLVAAYRQDREMETLLAIRSLLQQAESEVPLELSLATES